MGYIEDLRTIIGHKPAILCGSCGVIVAPDKRVLLQRRNEPGARWGLIGGLMELGESTEQTLIREAYEECGLMLNSDHLKLLGGILWWSNEHCSKR